MRNTQTFYRVVMQLTPDKKVTVYDNVVSEEHAMELKREGSPKYPFSVFRVTETVEDMDRVKLQKQEVSLTAIQKAQSVLNNARGMPRDFKELNSVVILAGIDFDKIAEALLVSLSRGMQATDEDTQLIQSALDSIIK